MRSLRREKGLRLRDVAAAADIDLSYLSRIERGTRLIPSKKIRTGIYTALNLSAGEMLKAEECVGKKEANTIFSAPLGAGKMILMVLNVKDAEKLLADADIGVEKLISRLKIKEAEM